MEFNRALRREYRRLFRECRVRSDKKAAVDALVDRLVAAKRRYGAVARRLDVPWFVPAVIHNMESSQNFSAHLHNGDPLSARTVREPPGRPTAGRPPFEWEASARDALELKDFGSWDDWGVAGTLYKLEGYNGWGYRNFHPDVKSPYLWSFSDHYTSGKYVADGRWDQNAVSQQCGAAVILRRMLDRDIIEFDSETEDSPDPGPSEDETPFLRFSPDTVVRRGKQLQIFLNRFPGVDLEIDGKLGPVTSEALERVTGFRLRGDPGK